MSKNLKLYKNLRSYKHLTFFNLINHILCNSILQNEYISSSFPSIYKTTSQIFSKSITNLFLYHTFCKVFTTGSNLNDVNINTQYLVKQNIPRLLTFYGLSVQNYNNTNQLDENSRKYKQAAQQASKHEDNIISIRISTLINTKLLRKYNKSIELRDKIWQQYSKDGILNAQSLFLAFKNIYSGVTDEDMQSYLKNIHNFHGQNLREFQTTEYQFKSNHHPFYLYQSQKNNQLLINILSPLDNIQKRQLQQFHKRIHLIAQGQQYKQSDLKIIIQGQQSFYEKAIQSISQQLQNHYNKQKAYIFSTNQGYFIRSKQYLDYQIYLIRKNNLFLAINLVKGQHLNEQQSLKIQKNNISHIVQNYQQSSSNFLNNFTTIIKQNFKGQVLATSNNEETVQSLLQIKRKGLQSSETKVSFIQFCGIGQNLSNKLLDLRQNVYKTTPYGEVNVVAPLIVSKIQQLSKSKSSYAYRLNLMKKQLSYRLFSQ